MERKYTVYKHTNKINGKVYIGITCQKVETRWKKGYGYQNQPYFYNVINKYGWDNFSHEILFEKLNTEQANAMEEKLILEYKSFQREFGYNLTSGGGAGYKFTEETRKKMSLAQIGSVDSNETREKKRLSSTGRKHSVEACIKIGIVHTGMKHTDEARKKMSLANTGRVLSAETRKKLSIINKGKIISAEQRVKISLSKIGIPRSEETRNKISLANKGRVLTKEECKRRSIAGMGGNNPFSKKVVCITTGVIFTSMSEAERFYNIKQGSISHYCSGSQKSAGKHQITGENLHWMRYDDYMKLNKQA